ncbi:MAG TPA: SRPBCC family protein [Roseateles sp.]|uniref:SRPBCC family protein n=1 Tax=Roseateles sp. TaxID=1971397 RepID=UPI002ED8EA21
MKALKVLLIAIVALLALCLGGGLMLSPKFTVSRTLTINAAPEKIYALIADPRGWQQWSAWNRRDPGMAIEYSGPASGAGAVWAWKSKSQGDGRMRFTSAEPPKRLGYDLFFPDFGTTSTGDFRLDANGGATQVTWTMNGDMGSNPVYRWMGLFMDKMVGPDFDAGLTNLKALAERP